jgi:hypothetical protein
VVSDARRAPWRYPGVFPPDAAESRFLPAYEASVSSDPYVAYPLTFEPLFGTPSFGRLIS